ncbi:transcription factor DIVARICATA-like [Phalaenopsis equestris]|uniref:transcription factor DIVARICATA-like n=1 Tax=Phalaenopsis equestris TaxID=78828 RepID=UPI0009E44DB9|nr:transcription factor DIVARICATA-like [Phalaenopsis equestris]XP_020588516.1 transcription factor DIVARICATA-like [Phalaenopsis equestris]
MMTNSWMEVISPYPAYLSNSNWILGEKKSGNWTQHENKLFENALAHFDEDLPDRWVKVAEMIPGKTVEDVVAHYRDLEDDVNCIEAGLIPFPGYSSSSFTLDWENDHGFDELRHACCVGGKRLGGRLAEHERKKGIPWTEEEHKRFLIGLKKYGKGDWRNISRNFVVTRTPTQVASHAQKYFIRLNSGTKEKRRASIHDIKTVSLEDSRSPSPSQPSVSSIQSSSSSAPATSEQFSMVVDSKLPNEVATVFSPSSNGNQFIQSSYGIFPYGMKRQPQSTFQCNLNGAIPGQNGVFF